MRVRANRWRQTRTAIFWLAIAVAVLGAALGVWIYVTRDTNPIPKDIRSELTFSPLVTSSDSKTFKTTQFGLVRSEADEQILTYTINFEGIAVKVSQYTQPPEFTDVAEYKDRFLNNVVQQTSTVATANGTIYLGQLAKQGNEQIGVMIEKGLLVFMDPDKQLDEVQWRRLGEALEIKKTEL